MAATEIKKYLKTLDKRKKIFMILGMMSNKDHKEFIKILKNEVNQIIALDIPNQIKIIKKEKLSKIAKSCGIISKTESSIEKALKYIAKEDENAIILFAGSLYFAAEVLNLN